MESGIRRLQQEIDRELGILTAWKSIVCHWLIFIERSHLLNLNLFFRKH